MSADTKNKINNYFMNYIVAGTGITGDEHFQAADKEAAKRVVASIVSQSLTHLGKELTSIHLWEKVPKTSNISNGWSEIMDLNPKLTDAEQVAEQLAIALTDSIDLDETNRVNQ